MAVRELTEAEVEVLWHRWRQGDSLRRIGRDIGASTYDVRRYMLRCGGVRPPARKRADRHLTVAEREFIAAGVARGDSYRAIARRLGRAASTISREVGRNGGPDAYRPCLAEDRSRDRRSRRKPSKLAVNHRLRAQVAQWLQLQWSPEQIAHRLPLEYPDDPLMRVSHECIYLLRPEEVASAVIGSGRLPAAGRRSSFSDWISWPGSRSSPGCGPGSRIRSRSALLRCRPGGCGPNRIRV
jgi:DNA-binding CsgD family transcriptional regulator